MEFPFIWPRGLALFIKKESEYMTQITSNNCLHDWSMGGMVCRECGMSRRDYEAGMGSKNHPSITIKQCPHCVSGILEYPTNSSSIPCHICDGTFKVVKCQYCNGRPIFNAISGGPGSCHHCNATGLLPLHTVLNQSDTTFVDTTIPNEGENMQTEESKSTPNSEHDPTVHDMLGQLKEVLFDTAKHSDQNRIAVKGLQIITTLLSKNQDYGSSVFKVPLLCPDMNEGDAILVRLSDKISRINNLLTARRNFESKGVAVKTESIEDTFLDMVGYIVLWLCRPENKSDFTP